MRTSFTIFSIFLTACGGGLFAPEEGEWVFSNLKYTSNGCNFSPAEAEVRFTLSVLDEETIAFEIDGVVQECDLDDMAFDCGTIEVQHDFSEFDISALATDETSTTGEFLDSTTGTMMVATSLVCEGDECDTIGVGGDEEGNGSVLMPCDTSSRAEIQRK